MKILVAGVIKDLTVIDGNGTEWTQDFVADCDDIFYDNEKEMYVTDPETFEWWSDIVAKENRISEMEEQLSEEDRERYVKDNGNWCDLETTVNQQLCWLEEHLNGIDFEETEDYSEN